MGASWQETVNQPAFRAERAPRSTEGSSTGRREENVISFSIVALFPAAYSLSLIGNWGAVEWPKKSESHHWRLRYRLSCVRARVLPHP